MSLRDFMTPQPWTVLADDSVKIAREMMDVRGVHHLPVVDGGEVVGVLTAREVAARGDRLGTAADLMHPVPCVPGETALAESVELMLREHSDAVVVTSDGKVEGIFTTTDALRMLAQLARETDTGPTRT